MGQGRWRQQGAGLVPSIVQGAREPVSKPPLTGTPTAQGVGVAVGGKGDRGVLVPPVVGVRVAVGGVPVTVGVACPVGRSRHSAG